VANLLRRFNAVETRHADIDYGGPRLQLLCQFYGGSTVSSLGGHLETLTLKQGPESLSE
jgi:hypothetical protein